MENKTKNDIRATLLLLLLIGIGCLGAYVTYKLTNMPFLSILGAFVAYVFTYLLMLIWGMIRENLSDY